MHKTVAVLIGSTILFNSVLAPSTAKAQVIDPSSLTSNSTSTLNLTTTKVSSIQELKAPETYSVTLTSYNAVPSQTDGTPNTTSIGVWTNPEVIAARSRDLADELPYGTIIAVEGPSSTGGASCGYSSVKDLIGYRVIGDAMNARMHDKIDVLLNPAHKVQMGYRKMNPSIALGACTGVKISVVGYVDPAHIPATQAALADLVDANQNLASAQF